MRDVLAVCFLIFFLALFFEPEIIRGIIECVAYGRCD